MMLELIIAILLLTLAVGPMIASFTPSFNALSGTRQMSMMTTRGMGTLNRVSGLAFSTLDTYRGSPASLTSLLGSAQEAANETFTFKGKSYTPVVNITDAGGSGLLEVSVTLDTITLQTLRADY